MTGRFLSTENLPFCKGCGHGLVAGAWRKPWAVSKTSIPGTLSWLPTSAA